MGETKTQTNVLHEHCEDCGQSTPHRVTLEIRTEAKGVDKVGHSRTPYRVTECKQCGRTVTCRMNNV